MVFPFFLFVCLLFETIYRAAALHVELRGGLGPYLTAKRDHVSGLENDGNLYYIVNVTLGGQPFEVLIDTGSSDFWVANTITAATGTGVHTEITYALGNVSGDVKAAQLDVLGYTVPDQAFLEVTSSSGTPPVSGVLGLGPNSGSRIHASLNNQPQGDAVLDRIFQQNVSTPNILTVLLGRSKDPAETYPGNLTVGEYLQGFENVTNQPREPVTALPPDSPDQHWQVLIDEDGIIGPDGQPIQVQTGVQGTQNPKQLTAVFDTGFSFSQVPQEVSSAIYSGIPGASLQSVDGLGPIWLIPCDAEINITFKFGGQGYPIHPLDTNSDGALASPDGQVCLGAFQPMSFGTPPYYDLILGAPFLRNVYLLINFGDFVDGRMNTTADPYVQLLSTTDPAAAHADFVSARVNHTATSSAYPTQTPSLEEALKSSRPGPSSGSSYTGHASKKTIIIVFSIVGGLLLLAFIVACCCTRDRVFFRRGRPYRQLGAPTPLAEFSRVRGYDS